MLLKFNSLSTRVALSYSLIAIVLTLSVATTIWQSDKANNIARELNTIYVPTNQSILTMLDGMNKSLAALRGWMILGDEKFLNERKIAWSEKINPGILSLEELKPEWNNRDYNQVLAIIKSYIPGFERDQIKIETLAHTTDNIPALKLFKDELIPREKEIISNIEKFRVIYTNPSTSTNTMKNYEFVHQYSTNITTSKILLNEYLSTRNDVIKNRLISNIASLNTLITSNDDILNNAAKAHPVLIDALTNTNEFDALINTIITMRESEQWNIANYMLASKAAPAAQEIVAQLEKLLVMSENKINQYDELTNNNNKILSLMQWSLLIFGLILSLALGFIIVRMVSKPLNQAVSVASAVAEGDFDVNTTLSGTSEFQLLSQALSNMTRSLKETSSTAAAVASGNMDVEVVVRGDKDILAKSVVDMLAKLRSSKEESERQLNNIKDSENRANSIINNMEDGLVNISSTGIITLFNPSAERIFQYSAEEVIGRNIKMLVPSPHSEKHDNYLSAYIRTGDRRFIGAPREVMAQRKDGSTFPASIVVSEIKVAGMVNFIGTVRDFTKQKLIESKELKAREELQNEKEKLLEQDWLKSSYAKISQEIQGQRTLESMFNVLLSTLVPTVNAQLGIYYNRDNVELAEESDINNTIVSLYASYAYTQRNTMVNQYQLGEGIVGQAALERKTILLTDVPADYIKIDTGSGRHTPGSIIVIPIVFGSDLLGVLELATLTNFTPLQLELLKQLSTNLGVFINTIIGRSRAEYLLERSQLQAKELKNRELQLQETNTKLNAKTQAAELANKSKSEFLANMSHELRTPLNSLLILADSLASNREKNLSDQQKEAARIIHQSGTDLLTLINDILDLAKVEAGKIIIRATRFDMSELVSDINNKFKHIAEAKGLTFTINVSKDCPQHMHSDLTRVSQVARNFLSNAFKFTHQGSITVNIQKADSERIPVSLKNNTDEIIELSVTDTGIGIPSNKLSAIFDAFEQVDGSTSRQYGGTGLGLSIVREMVHLLGGDVTVESQLTQGSVFTVFLPLTYQALQGESATAIDSNPLALPGINMLEADKQRPPFATTKAQLSTISDERASLNSKDNIILIIEDDPSFAEILRDSARSKGFKTIVTMSGQEGIVLAKKYKPSAVILDIGLPDISGLEVFNKLLADKLTSNIPVYFISVYDDNRDVINKGAIGYLTKPVTQKQLELALERIKSIIGNPINTLLVVEDDAIISEHLAQTLRSQEIDVITTESAEAALEILKSRNVGAMILDIGLPGMSGIDLLDKIAATSGLSQPPVIIYSSKDLTTSESAKLDHYNATVILKNSAAPEKVLEDVMAELNRNKILVEEIIESSPTVSEVAKATVQATVADEAILKGKRVLLVDDDTRNIFAISLLLKQMSMNVVMAENGQQALSVLEKDEKFDIVLMDIMMPIMDGYEAISKIREQAKFKDLAIIAVTAKAMAEDREKCLAVGANDYLAKPVDATRLFTIIGHWLVEKPIQHINQSSQ